MVRFRDRSTGDILVLAIAGTICFSVLAEIVTVAVVSILNPGEDVGWATLLVSDTLTALVGLLAGFLAGRTDARGRNGNGTQGSA